MGLLSRIGKNVAEQFPNNWRGRSPFETVVPSAMLGGAIGGMGAAAQPGDVTNEQFGGAAGIGALLGAAVPVGVGAKRVVMAIAQALKHQHPNIPDEAILQKATELAKQQGKLDEWPPLPPRGDYDWRLFNPDRRTD